MRPSRGMGDIAPSKMPKARTIKKKDGNEPVKVFKEGGKVRRFKEGGLEKDMAQNIAKRKKREDSSGLRFEGEGGKNEYATSIGGRLSYDIPAGEDATISPYIEGFVAKPKDRKLMGEATGAGVVYKKRFKSGGKVNEAGNYTKPGLRKRIFNSVKAAAVQGTGAGQWSARKSQLLAKRYKASGGGYRD
jgi:hypothetical protein